MPYIVPGGCRNAICRPHVSRRPTRSPVFRPHQPHFGASRTAGLAVRLGLGQFGVWWTAALVVTMPAVYSGAYGGFVDALFAAFVLAAARIAFDAETPRHYALF